MNKKTALFTIIIAITGMLVACEADFTTEKKSEMVVEGWIDEGGYPVVILTKSLTISDKYQRIDSLAQYLIRWAKVTVSDGERKVVLTGKYDSRFFPPYIYTTGNMRGVAGKTYTLDIEYKDWHATATTTIPETHPIKNIRLEQCAESDTMFQVKLDIDTEKAHNAYYQLFTCEGTNNRLFVASYLGSIDGAALKKDKEITVYRSHRVATGKKYIPYFCLNDTLAIKLAHIDNVSYNFWSDYSRNLTMADNLFMAPTHNIRGNVNGATGYWCGMGADVKYVVIKKDNE